MSARRRGKQACAASKQQSCLDYPDGDDAEASVVQVLGTISAWSRILSRARAR